MLHSVIDTKNLNCTRNFSEIFSRQPYALMKLFSKKFDQKMFGASSIAKIMYAIGAYSDNIDLDYLADFMELCSVHSRRSVELINSSALLAASKPVQIVDYNKEKNKIKLTQFFPCKERQILKCENEFGSYKILTYPLAIGGYAAWSKNIAIFVAPKKIKSGIGFSCFLHNLMGQVSFNEINVDMHRVEKEIGVLSNDHSAYYDIVIVDRKNKDTYTSSYSNVKGKSILEGFRLSETIPEVVGLNGGYVKNMSNNSLLEKFEIEI